MIYLVGIFAIIIFDQITKYFAEGYLQQIDTYPLIQDVFHLTYRRNTGAAFSILRDKQSILIIFSIIVVIILIVYLFKFIKEDNALLKISLTFVIGGAVGNLIDRIRLNYVIDFFDFTLINFAVFNVADSFIVIGSLLIAYGVIFKKIDI